MTKKKQTERYVDCCNDCGKNRYIIRQEVNGITLHHSICPLCKKDKMIIPARDWRFMEGDDSCWD